VNDRDRPLEGHLDKREHAAGGSQERPACRTVPARRIGGRWRRDRSQFGTALIRYGAGGSPTPLSPEGPAAQRLTASRQRYSHTRLTQDVFHKSDHAASTTTTTALHLALASGALSQSRETGHQTTATPIVVKQQQRPAASPGSFDGRRSSLRTIASTAVPVPSMLALRRRLGRAHLAQSGCR
jgi:hypothetical protein